MRNKTAVVGVVVGVGVVFMALLAPVIAPYDPLRQNVFYRLTGPESAHLFGTDAFGRDVLSRVIYGARISLLVGGASVLMGMVTGTLLGMAAGLLRGKVETSIMRAVDVVMCFPDLVLGIMVMAVLGSGLSKLIITIGIVMTPRFARMAYGTTLSITEQDYIDAARSVGTPVWRMLLRHVLPNCLGGVLVMASLWMGAAIRIEANLSFIGLGVPPPTPTWGNMIRAGIDHLTNAPWLSVFPGLAILITILAFNMLGDGIRDVTDPRLRGG